MEKTSFSIANRLKSFKYAYNGLQVLVTSEHNARIHGFATVVAILLGLLLHISKTEWLILSLVIAQVFICEIFNTCFEILCNHISTEYQEFIKKVKDLSAAAVLISAMISVVTGLIIFLPKLLEIIRP